MTCDIDTIDRSKLSLFCFRSYSAILHEVKVAIFIKLKKKFQINALFFLINDRYRYYFVTGIIKRYVIVTINEG